MKTINLIFQFTFLCIFFSISTEAYSQWEPVRFFQEDEADKEPTAIAMNQQGDIMAAGFGRSVVTETSTSLLGRVVVYKEINGEWQQLGNDIQGDVFAAQLGREVVLNSEGNRILISQDFVSDTNSNGAYKVFEIDENNTWNQVGNTVELPNGIDFRSGPYTSAMNAAGDRIAVVSGYTIRPFNISGEVLVYDLVDNEWQQVGQSLFGEVETDFFGVSIAMNSNGDRLVVSAAGDKIVDFGDEPVFAYAKIYDLIDNSWEEMARISNEDNVGFGSATVRMNNDGSIITLNSNDFDVNQDEEQDQFSVGQIRVFETVDGSNWTQKGDPIVNPFNLAATGGSVVDISDDGLTIGVAYSEIRVNTGMIGAGQVELYKFVDGNWQIVDQPIILGDEPQTILFATSMAMNGEGDRVAIANLGWDGENMGGILEIYDNTKVLSIPTISTHENIKFYPNPSSSDFSIDFNKSFKSVTIVISDLSGKLVYTKDISGRSSTPIKISHQLTPGMYLAKVTIQNKDINTFTQKLQVR